MIYIDFVNHLKPMHFEFLKKKLKKIFGDIVPLIKKQKM